MSVRATYDRFWTSPLALVGSLGIHALLAWLIVTNMSSCGPQGEFGRGEEFREVGIYVVNDQAETTEETEQQTESPEETLPEVPQDLNQELNQPMQETPLPALEMPALIGPGPQPTGSMSEDIAEVFAKSSPSAPSSAEGIPSTTSFFDIETGGRTIVYLIDCSGSMSKHNAFRHAKAEMIASLERLDSHHKFQILFYSDSLYEFRDRQGAPDTHWATASNLTRARSYINQLDNSGGTSHFPALMKALSYSPEVIYFLTDAAEPALEPSQLNEIQRKNRGKAAIHCIEFGLGPELRQKSNFLKQLSQQNGGSYRYRDMAKLGF